MENEDAYARIEVLHGDKIQSIKNEAGNEKVAVPRVFGKAAGLEEALDVLDNVVDIDDVPDAGELLAEGMSSHRAAQLQMVSRQSRAGELGIIDA